MRRMLVAVCLLAAIGCKKKNKSGHEDSPERKKAKQAVLLALPAPKYLGPGSKLAVKPLPPAAGKPGAAYLWIDHTGLVTIDKTGAATLARFPDPPGIIKRYVTAMVLDGDDPVMLASDGVFKITAGQQVDLGHPFGEYAGAGEVIGIAPDRTLWVAGNDGIARLVFGEWKQDKKVKIEDLTSIDFDGAGHVFLTGRYDVWAYDGTEWLPVIETKNMTEGDSMVQPWWHQTVVTPTGELWLLGCDHLLKIGKGDPVAVQLDDPGFSGGRFVGNTLVGASCFTNTLVRISPEGDLAEVTPATRIEGFTRAIDRRGRMWLNDRAVGGTLVAADGTLTTWPSGSIAAINGEVGAIAVAGTGPDALPKQTPELRATITGKVLEKGAPIAHVAIELCRSPLEPKPSPCSSDPNRVAGETDANGAFHISVPLRKYEATTNANGAWYWLINHECSGMDPKGTCDIGTLELSKTLNPTDGGLRFINNHDGDAVAPTPTPAPAAPP